MSFSFQDPPSIIVNAGRKDDDLSDTESVSSYENLRHPHSRPRPSKPRKNDYAVDVDGAVPKVLYLVYYYDENYLCVTTRQSLTPFEEIPNVDRRGRDLKAAGNGLRPVLEIVTKVNASSLAPGGRHPPRRGAPNPSQQERPVTMAFHQEEYRTEDYYSDEEQVQEPGPHIGQPYMVINSEYLTNALKAVISYYPKFSLNGKTVKIHAPYRVLYQHRKELEGYRFNQPSVHSDEDKATTKAHIDVLLEFLDQNLGKEILEEERRHQSPSPMATFELFWLLLKPGQVIYSKRNDIWTPYVISSVSTGQLYPDCPDNYRINAWMLESNGVKVDRFMECFSVAPWMGEQAISSLPVIPEAFWEENLEAQGGRTMREKLVEEGKLYWELLKRPTYMEYDGLLVNSWSGNRRPEGPTGFMCGRVVCDASGFDKYHDLAVDCFDNPRGPRFRYNPPVAFPPSKDHIPTSKSRCGCKACSTLTHERGDGPFMGFESLDPLHDTPPESDLFYLVLCKTIPGFILGSRKWGNLHLANLKPVQCDKEAFKYLVLDDEIKLTVKALIGKFATSVDGQISPWGNDFVKNKGEGRIFLLHGTPGVGKTCTAECVAELTNRPLISLTSGDLSVDSWRVERNLSYFLELGQRYGALVLLDEADVYLERRRSKDIDRNGLVSVFLRALEYYRGVLFLTTNRVQSFDGAFLSRIHVALHYKNLRDEDRERIWTSNFDRIDRDSAGHVHVAVAAREYVWNSREVRALRWNGREIRNAMQTALALAENEAEEEALETIMVTEKHLRAVVKMSKGFKDYIKRTALVLGRYDEDELDDNDEGSEADIQDD